MNEQVNVTMKNGQLNITAPIKAQDSLRYAAEEMVCHNNGRILPPLGERKRKIMEDEALFIFNVSPNEFTRHMGSSGTFIIRACPEDAEYSEPLKIPGIVPEPLIKDQDKMYWMEDEGEYFAQQTIGVGRGQKPNDALTKYGVFISKTNPPTKADLAKARETFHNYCQVLVNEADEAMSMGVDEWQKIRTNDHIMAARVLKLTEKDGHDWLKQTTGKPKNREECPNCGTQYTVGIAQCSNCKAIIDKQKYVANVKAGMIPGVTLESLGVKG